MENLEYILNVLEGKETLCMYKIKDEQLCRHIVYHLSLENKIEELNDTVQELEDKLDER